MSFIKDVAQKERWQEAAYSSSAVCRKLTLANCYDGALISVVSGVIFCTLIAVSFSAIPHTGTCPNGSSFDNTTAHLGVSYTFTALAGATGMIGTALALLAKKARNEITNDTDDTLLNRLKADQTPESLHLAKWEKAKATSRSVANQVDSKYLPLLILIFLIPFLAPGITLLSAGHSVADFAGGGVCMGLCLVVITVALVAHRFAQQRQEEIRKDTNDVLLNQLIAQDLQNPKRKIN